MAISVTSIKDNNIVARSTLSSVPASTTGAMKNAFIASGILHAFIFVVSLIGLPFLAKEAPLIITPVSDELVDIAEITQTMRVATPKKEDKPKPIEKPEPPRPVQAAPKVTSEAPPKLEDIKSEKPEKPKDVNKEPPKPEPIVEAKKEKPKPKKEDKPKPKDKPKPQEDQFASLLKNLAPDAEEAKEWKMFLRTHQAAKSHASPTN